MKLHTPGSIEQAAALLAQGGEIRCLAGGQSLVAMMNARLVTPMALVSLRRIPGLDVVAPTGDGGVRIGAMARHADVARYDARHAGPALLRQTASRIGHPAIRNQGTIGGSLAHADPSADYPVAALCTDAQIVATGLSGKRVIPAASFFRGFYETALAPSEMIVAVEIPPGPAGAAAHYEKFSLVDGDFAIISVAVMLAMENGRCAAISVAVGGCAPTPLRLEAAEAALAGTRLADVDLAKAGTLLADASDPIDDFRGTAAYRRKLVPRMVARAVHAARQKHG